MFHSDFKGHSRSPWQSCVWKGRNEEEEVQETSRMFKTKVWNVCQGKLKLRVEQAQERAQAFCDKWGHTYGQPEAPLCPQCQIRGYGTHRCQDGFQSSCFGVILFYPLSLSFEIWVFTLCRCTLGLWNFFIFMEIQSYDFVLCLKRDLTLPFEKLRKCWRIYYCVSSCMKGSSILLSGLWNCYCLYLEIMYGLKGYVWVWSWQGVDCDPSF